MIKITLQRNDSKAVSDKVSYTQGRPLGEDTITLNEQEFAFPLGDDVQFVSPHEQIINPHRDADGTLHATIIKQYIGKDRSIFETCDEHGNYCQCENDNTISNIRSSKLTTTIVKIKIEEVKATTVADLIRNKESEVKELKDQYVDADLDDNDKLQLDLKKQIQTAKQEIALLKENLENE